MNEGEWERIQKVLIGKSPASAYLWNFFTKAFVSELIGLQYHAKYAGTAKILIDGLKNFGWVQQGEAWNTSIDTKDRESNQTYQITVTRVLMEKLGAIKGI